MAKFPSTLGATRREFARVIIEARGDTSLSCTPDPFTDVTCAANPNDGKYVQKMKDIGITSGCGGGGYCPDAQTQRDQSAVFFLKGEASHCPLNVNGCTYTPPSCTTTHVFADVPCPSQYADWVGELYQENITAGCGGNNFCPTNPLGSWQMLAWANKIWGSYAPLPRDSVLTYRDEGGRVSTEANQALATGDSSAVMVYPRDNIFLGSQLVASAAWIGTSPNYQFFAVDHLGTPRLVTDITANPVGDPPQLRKFWPYGDDAAMSGPDSGQQLKLAGMQRDLETEHYYDHARTEDFSIGRFLSPDLLRGGTGNPQSWNRYAYVMNNPMTLTDPMGFETNQTGCVTTDDGSGGVTVTCPHIPADWPTNAVPNTSDTPTWDSFRSLGWRGFYRNRADAAWGSGHYLAYGIDRIGADYLPLIALTAAGAALVGPAEASIPIIGKMDDVEVAAEWAGHQVFQGTEAENIAWMTRLIERGESVYLASEVTAENLINHNTLENALSRFAMELRMLMNAGYTRIGDMLVPPGR